MKTQELFSVLKEHGEKSLLFQYAPNQIVAANYHITEVKHIQVASVDCGGQMEHWNETIIQLWESPTEIGKTDFMPSHKALEILNRVGTMKSYDQESLVRFEYSNALFHTAQLFVTDFEIHGNNLVLNLSVADTDCKAKELCGVPEPASASNNSCAPGSGCC
jgi:hypothetical protein